LSGIPVDSSGGRLRAPGPSIAGVMILPCACDRCHAPGRHATACRQRMPGGRAWGFYQRGSEKRRCRSALSDV